MDHVLQHGAVDRRISNLGLVIAMHVAVGASLFFAVREIPPPDRDRMTVTIVRDLPPPEIPATPQIRPIAPRVSTQQRHEELPPDQNPIETNVAIATDNNINVVTPNINTSVDSPSLSGANSGTPSIGTATPDIAVVCPNMQSVQSQMRYPIQARREGIQGAVTVQFMLSANGEVKNPRILSSANTLLNRAALSAVAQFQCMGLGRDMLVEAPFYFRLAD
jgi:periplasmic protein TonB